MLSKQKILDSIKSVVEQSSFVSIDEEAIDRYVKGFASQEIIHWTKGSNAYPLGYKPQPNKEDEIDFLFLLANQAFCYWGYPQKWTISFRGQNLDGWWANIAAFERAIEQGNNILDGNFLANLTLEKTREIYAGEPEIPLLKERYEMMKKIGEVLVAKYQGHFHNFFEEYRTDAFRMMEGLSTEFAGFYDVPKYKGNSVLFYKKTQVFLTDVAYFDKPLPKTDEILGFADYKIPAIMRTLGFLKYSKPLAEKVDNRVELAEASGEEIEIRANMLMASYLTVEKLRPKYPKLNYVDFLGILWLESQDKTKIDKPYHLTKTVYY